MKVHFHSILPLHYSYRLCQFPIFSRPDPFFFTPPFTPTNSSLTPYLSRPFEFSRKSITKNPIFYDMHVIEPYVDRMLDRKKNQLTIRDGRQEESDQKKMGLSSIRPKPSAQIHIDSFTPRHAQALARSFQRCMRPFELLNNSRAIHHWIPNLIVTGIIFFLADSAFPNRGGVAKDLPPKKVKTCCALCCPSLHVVVFIQVRESYLAY